MSTAAHNIAGKARAITFGDWQNSAISGYVAGGANRFAATEIVNAATSDIEALVTKELNAELLQTFLVALDLEAGRFVRRHGAALFSVRD
jgi:hypothetical protein